MANRQLVNTIVQLYKKLGGNTNDVLGTKTNVSFLGKGKSPELMLDMDINEDALAILPQSKAVEELTSSVGYAVAGKLNDIQANKLLSNMKKMENVYFPPAEPKNVTDIATRIGGLDKAGLMSLRGTDMKSYLRKELGIDDLRDPDYEAAVKGLKEEVDLPPPGSRGGPDDIAAPTQSADEAFRNMAKAVDESQGLGQTGRGLESIKNVQNNNLIVNELVDTIYLNAGVTPAAQPTVRANARDFLNRIKDLEDPQFPGGPTLSSVMEPDDFKFMTEGGGAGLGDPLLLVQKYFGPKVAIAIAKIDNPKDIQTFAERLVRVKDGRGRSVTDRMFDPKTVNPEDFEFADGGRVPFFIGGAAGRMGFQALRKYGFTGKDISRAFAGLGTDKTLVGKEKTEYFKQLNKVLKNPDDYPDAIKELQKQLGIEVGIGFRSGGLAKILEV